MVKSLDRIVEKLHDVNWKKTAKYTAFAAAGAAAGGLGVWGGLYGLYEARLTKGIEPILNSSILLGLVFNSCTLIGAKLGIVGAKIYDKNYKDFLNELKLLPYEIPSVLAGGYAGTKIGEKISQDVFPIQGTWFPLLGYWDSQPIQDFEYAVYGSIVGGILGFALTRYAIHMFKKRKQEN